MVSSILMKSFADIVEDVLDNARLVPLGTGNMDSRSTLAEDGEKRSHMEKH